MPEERQKIKLKRDQGQMLKTLYFSGRGCEVLRDIDLCLRQEITVGEQSNILLVQTWVKKLQMSLSSGLVHLEGESCECISTPMLLLLSHLPSPLLGTELKCYYWMKSYILLFFI